MKFWQAPSPAEATAALLLLATPAASMLKCEDMVADSHKFNLKPLGGPHSVTVSHMAGGSYHNTTYTVDLCASLRWKSDVDKTHQCPQNTRVCAVERLVGTGDNKFNAFSDVFPVAGDLRGRGGQPLDHELVNLRTSNSHEDSKKEGVLVILKGGFHDVNEQRRPQRTIIEVVCDPDKEGTEGEWKAEGDYVPGDPAQERAISTATNPLFYVSEEEGGKGDDDDAKPDKPVQVGDTANQALLFNSYGPLETNSDTDVLRLTWKTKYACESASTPGGGGKDQASSHWGFFTWLVILVFLGTAAYLIFGSWLNYNRYGARGWDLLPHGDTIRDIPYLMKDWTRRVLNTVQGSGSRGGYSAV